jgi:NAD(P)-dependent dehydrogenase (short-subunit alcohol dehydrogenase family)
MVQSTLRRFGRLDYAFNNAGILGEAKPLAELTPENWQRVIGANLTGVFLSLLHEIPALLKTGGGVIVNNASVLGTVATPGLAPYVAAKHGVIGLTKTAALEYGRQNIRVNAVCPGYVCTPLLDSAGLGTETEAGQSFAAMQALGRFASPEEIAAVVLWLCSDQASFVTGHALLADGGYSAQ